MIVPAPQQALAGKEFPPNSNGALPRVLVAIALDGTHRFGSLQEQIYFLARAFRSEGSLLLPLFLDSGAPNNGVKTEFEIAGLPTANLTLWRFRWRVLWQLTKLIDEHDIQLVHWHFYQPINAYILALAALRPRLHHYFTDHNSRPVPLPQAPGLLKRTVKRLILKRYRKVLCVSQFVERCLAEQQSWSNSQACLHFINTDRFRPDSKVRQTVRRQLGREDHFIVLVVAHLIKEKGVDVAIRALAGTGLHTVLWIVGTGAEEVNLKALAVELGLQDRVTFFGQQRHVQRYLQAADCLACPSMWAEAAGLANLEALSTGLPVLASRIGGIPEYVQDGQTGILFPPGDYHALATELRRLDDRPDECRRLSETARATMVRRFSVHSKINEYLDLYRTCS